MEPMTGAPVLAQHLGEDFALYNVDTVEFTAAMPSASVDFSVYSPPFSSLYIYSESARDMGNVAGDEEFFETYRCLIREKLRVTRPGRLTAIHVKDLVYYSNSSANGDRGLRDFTGACIRAHIEEGWTFHGRVTVWRDPVREMQKAKPDGLLFKNFRTDAARVRFGLPEYVVTFRKWASGMDDTPAVTHDTDEFPLEVWQRWASPVWMDCRETDVINARLARDPEAEKHLCPMPLDLTERLVRLYSRRGETVYSPFMGVGSEGVVALKCGRRFVGTELKPSYYAQACKEVDHAAETYAGGTLFDRAADAEAAA
ncbi:DNA-methyltransferase [Methylopila musalis]|uniref:Methyltransferase n=1 Tax=Methylopila musalis TaxID=1134781 RepID=A0ABW3Z481_9HYPH